MHANHGRQTNKIHQTCRLYPIPGTLTPTQAGTVLYVSLAQHLYQSRAVCVCVPGPVTAPQTVWARIGPKCTVQSPPKKSKKLLSGWQSELPNVQLLCTIYIFIYI